MRTFEIIGKGLIGMERISQRVQDAVEIFERETIRTIKLNNDHNAMSIAAEPKLVIDDALTATKVFISKARSEAGGLNSVLSEVMASARKTK